ncbi:aldose 1-epimerase [Tautonia sociabilis]|uniref:Aldose 1-epimerase n=1 Tax=Tautonia sociabilis TaxID=2080755 RepID=A0A432MS17_9BACT|nr:aldose 1-epimerase [Tautonia sociabilis]RUL89766.1 aldose 1-epimerase [Tautonia sociabilis]
MACHVRTETRGNRPIFVLSDTDSGASASILPSYGFNLFDLHLPAAGAPRSLVVTAPGWEKNPEKPARHGFPVLFPFPNRIKNGRFSWGGTSYSLPLTKPPHAIHGFALDAEWEVIDHGEGPDGAFLTGRYRLPRTFPNGAPCWPSDGYLDIRYALHGRSLTLDATIANESEGDLPYGLGFHPYFRLPFGGGGDLDRTKVVIPASRFWVLDDSIPTGATLPVDDALDFRRGKPMRGLQVDAVLTGLEHNAEGFVVCRLVDEQARCEFRIGFDAVPFREVVVFTPPNAPDVIAVEPYTQTTDAINLQQRGVDAGLRVLRPGQQESLRIAMETADF